MTDPTSPHPRPAPWAVGLLVFSCGFAVLSIALCSTGYVPL